MAKRRTPIQEPFDLALSEFYRVKPRMALYKRLVVLGAEIGDPLAPYAMATWYLHGNSAVGVQRDIRKANDLLDTCAATLNRAAYDLAVSKLRGIGVKKDPRAAFRLFVRASTLGSLAAMEEQARCLRLGIGTKRDAASAKFLMQRVSLWKKGLRKARTLPTASKTTSCSPDGKVMGSDIGDRATGLEAGALCGAHGLGTLASCSILHREV